MGNDKRTIEEEKYFKRFHNILEYISPSPSLNEVGEDPNAMGADPNAMGDADPNAMGGDPNAMMGADPNAMGADPNAMGADPNAMGGDPNAMMGADPNAMGGVEGFDPQGADPNAMGADPNAMGEEPDASGDADEEEENKETEKIANSQKDTEKKVGKISAKFDKLLDMLDNFTQQLDSNSNDISNLKAEFEKRNPTPEEKLSLRSRDGYPFNISVDDYWQDKEANSNYSTEDDHNGEDSEIYKITKSDIDDIGDWRDISKSLDDNEYHMTLKDIINF